MSYEPVETDNDGKVRTDAENKQLLKKELIQKIEEKVPAFFKPAVKYIVVIGFAFLRALNFLVPLVSQGYEMAQKLYVKYEKYNPYDLGAMFTGLVLIFFGGYFVTTIAVVEAFRVSGWSQFSGGVKILWADFKKVQEASKEDDQKDEDHDGVPDVQQISSSELITRKTGLFFRVADPVKLSSALNGIYSGLVAVMATLKVKFARVITLGASIGEKLSQPLTKVLSFLGLIPIITYKEEDGSIIDSSDHFIPKEYHKWVPVVIDYVARSVGIYIAWIIQRILAAFHSAVRGSYMFTEAFARWTESQGMPEIITKGYFDEIFCFVCAVLGIYIQVTSWFSLPTILWLLLFPMVLFETLLSWFVGFQ